MVVAQQHRIDPRQILPQHARLPLARGPIQAIGLTRSDQTGSVSRFAPPCCNNTVEWLIRSPQVVALYITGRLERNHVVNKAWRRIWPASELPSQHVQKPAYLWRVRIEVPFAVEMFGKGGWPKGCCTFFIYSQLRPLGRRCEDLGGALISRFY